MVRVQFSDGIVEYPEASQVVRDGDYFLVMGAVDGQPEVIAEFLAHEGLVLG